MEESTPRKCKLLCSPAPGRCSRDEDDAPTAPCHTVSHGLLAVLPSSNTTCSTDLNKSSHNIAFAGSVAILSPGIGGAFTPRYPKDVHSNAPDSSAVITPKTHFEDNCIRSCWTPPPFRSLDDDDDTGVIWLSTNPFPTDRGLVPFLEEEEDDRFVQDDRRIRLQPRKSSRNEIARIGRVSVADFGGDPMSMFA